MSVKDSTTLNSPSQQVNVLRQELKEWEKAFAGANGGRKAGRDDIKKHTSIAAKYKTYNRLREQSFKCASSPSRSKSRRQSPEHQSSKKRKRPPLDDIQPPDHVDQALSQTPQKSLKQNDFSTPAKSRLQQQSQESPSTLRKLFSPIQDRLNSPWPFVTHVGPTPQRDGKILGLFDMLSESGGSVESATRRGCTGGLDAYGSRSDLIAKTPSKQKGIGERRIGGLLDVAVEDTPRARRHSRTPASNGRQFLLSTLYKTPAAFHITPTKQLNQALDLNPSLDAVSGPLQSSTSDIPAFLRRSQTNTHAMAITSISHEPSRISSKAPFVEDFGELSPVAVRMPPKLVGRGLSAIVQGLREMEDERMEDELDALREMEQEEMGGPPPPPPKPKLLVNNNQVNPFVNIQALDLAVDIAPIVEKDGADEKGAGAEQPTRVWKKRGQKRQTKRTIMKPRGKLKPMTVPAKREESEEAVAETQIRDAIHNDDDYHDSMDELSKPKPKPSAKKAKKEKAQSAEKTKKPGRKQNAHAHANYRALKIKNKNSKGRGGGGGRRYGRR